MGVVNKGVLRVTGTILLLLCFIANSPAQPQKQPRGCGEDLNQKGLELEAKASQIFKDGMQGKNAAKIREAMRLYEETIKLEPRLITPYVNLALHYDVGEKNPEKALSLLKKGVSQCPEEADLYFVMGDVHASLRQHRNAVQSYEIALKLGYNGPLPSLYFNIGTNYLWLEDYNNAISFLKKAIDLDPKKLNAYQNLAVAYHLKGDKQNSRETLRQLEDLDPKGPFGQWARNAPKEFEKGQ